MDTEKTDQSYEPADQEPKKGPNTVRDSAMVASAGPAFVGDGPAPAQPMLEGQRSTFGMTYAPRRRHHFGPTGGVWLLPGLYFAVATVFALVVAWAYTHNSQTWLARYIVEGDTDRIAQSYVLAGVFWAGALASMGFTWMRGVVIHSDGIEVRDVMGMAWPKVRHCGWAEIDVIELNERGLSLRMWDGQQWLLPFVSQQRDLREMLERIGTARGIRLSGDRLRDAEIVYRELEG